MNVSTEEIDLKFDLIIAIIFGFKQVIAAKTPLNGTPPPRKEGGKQIALKMYCNRFSGYAPELNRLGDR